MLKFITKKKQVCGQEPESIMKRQIFLYRRGDILVQIGKDKQQLVCMINTIHESK
jgi:hypothetical protein